MAGKSLIANVRKVRQLVDSLDTETEFGKLYSILSALEMQVSDGHYQRHAVTRLCEALLATAQLYSVPEEVAAKLEEAACAVVTQVENRQ